METTTPSQPWEAESSRFKMIDVGHKPATARRAIAQGSIELAPSAYRALRERSNPKGDVLAMAEVAGIQAAKRTSELLPLCHPIPIHQVRLSFAADDGARRVTAFCEVATTAPTGVEMEALCGVNGALLAIYDLSKAVDPVLRISDVRLNVKEGGKSGRWLHPDHDEGLPRERCRTAEASASAGLPLQGMRAAVLTVSDRCSRGVAEDRSGPALRELLRAEGAEIAANQVVADEADAIARAVLGFCRESRAQLILTTGGTGLGPRDVTPEALFSLYDRRVPGIGELLRSAGARHTPLSWLSRAESGLIGSALVIPLPGSLSGSRQGMETLRELLPHAISMIRGGGH